MPWTALALTILPEAFPGPLGLSLAGQALARGDWRLEVVDIRDDGIGKHHKVDDTPAGGGVGLVMRADVLAAAIDRAERLCPGLPRLVMSPRGRPLVQARVKRCV